MLVKKLADRQITQDQFMGLYENRLSEIKDGQPAFLFEMKRFLALSAFGDILLHLYGETNC